MTRKEYIRRTLAALCGTAPARPDEYHHVARMADEVEHVVSFDTEDGNGTDDGTDGQGQQYLVPPISM